MKVSFEIQTEVELLPRHRRKILPYLKRNALIRGLFIALEDSGLRSADLYNPNPTDETLQKIVKLKNRLTIPKVKRGSNLETAERAIRAFIHFSMALSEFKDFSKAVGNTKYPGPRVHKGVLYLEKRIPRIVSFMGGDLKQSDIPSNLLRKLAPLPKKDLVGKLVAYFSGTKYETFRKDLAKAKRDNPELARLWRNGIF